jgi:hypothetical protein
MWFELPISVMLISGGKNGSKVSSKFHRIAVINKSNIAKGTLSFAGVS